MIQVHARPQPGEKGIALLGVLQRDMRTETNRLSSLPAGVHNLAFLILALRQITTKEDLLCAGRDVRQYLGIDPRDLQPTELHLQVMQRRLSDRVEQLQS